MLLAGGDRGRTRLLHDARRVLVGFALAAFVPADEARWRTAAGMALGVASVALLRCSTLFAGEAVGLIAGLVGGVLAATVARLVVGGGTAVTRR